MSAAVKLLGKLAAGFVDAAESQATPALLAGRIKGKPMAGNTVSHRLRSAICLAGNPHMAGVASLYPLRGDLVSEFRPSHLSDSTDLFDPSFDIRGPLLSSGLEAHLTFTVDQTATGEWQLSQVTPSSGYPGLRIEDPTVIRHIASSTLQAVTSRNIKPGLPWEPGVLTAGTRVVEALRDLIKQAS